MTISTAIDASVVARVLGVEASYRNLSGQPLFYLPIRIGVVGQGASLSSYSTDKRRVYSALEAGQVYGFGSPIHLAVMQLLPDNGDGVGTIPVTVYPLEDAVAGAPSAGDITPTVGTIVEASYKVNVGGVLSEPFLVEVGDNAAAIIAKMITAVNAVSAMPMIASDGTTKLDLDAKWDGTSGDEIVISVEGPTDAGVTWAYTQPTGGAANPDISTVLTQMGNVWETFMLNCFESTDTTILDAFKTVAEGKWGATVMKPFAAFVGDTQASVSSATTVPDARSTDLYNVQVVNPGSQDMPWVVAARQLARIAALANSNPPHDYGSQAATGLTPGADASQWTHTQRDAAVKAGSSTVEIRDNVVYLSDIVTMYHPTGDPLPAYRYVVDLIKLWNVMYNTHLILNTPDWDGAPLIPDDQPTTNPTAKKPKMLKAAIARMIDDLADEAIISDPAFCKSTILTGINESNPKRIDLAFGVKLSGNTNVKSVNLYFGFYLGAAPVVG